MPWVLYRINSGEVVAIRQQQIEVNHARSQFFSIVELKPEAFLDGTVTVPPSAVNVELNSRSVGYAKIYDDIEEIVRNATKAEIEGFIEEERFEVSDLLWERVDELVNDHPIFSRLFDVVLEEVTNGREDRIKKVRDRISNRRERLKADRELGRARRRRPRP